MTQAHHSQNEFYLWPSIYFVSFSLFLTLALLVFCSKCVCVCRSKVMRLKWRFYVIVSRRCCCLLRFIMPSSKKLNAITVIFSAIFLAFSFKIMNNVVIDLSRSIKFLVYAHSFSLFVLLSFVHAYLLLTNQKKLNSEFRRNKILIKFHFYIFSHSS